MPTPAPDGGLWTGPKVARYVRNRWWVTVRRETGWRWLVALGFTLQVPRPSHPKSAAHADPDENKVLVLVVDNAGWRMAGRLVVPANVRLHFLPPCTPGAAG